MGDGIFMLLTVGMIFIGLPWLALHYIAKLRGLPGVSRQALESGATLNELFRLAERLEERLRVIERIVAAEEKQGEKTSLQGLALPPSEENGGAPSRMPLAAEPHPEERKP